MTRQKFEELVAQGIDKIPEKFLSLIRNVAIVVEDEPSHMQRRSLRLRRGDSLFGLYEGIPQTEREQYSGVLPDKITIFMRPILDAAKAEDEVREIVKDTVWHEIAHHFGLNEHRVRAAEKRRHSKPD
jgi:predicted Zn-dependent protease with MMP-like domain